MDYVRIHAEALERVSYAINLVLLRSLSLAGLHAPSCALSLPRVLGGVAMYISMFLSVQINFCLAMSL